MAALQYVDRPRLCGPDPAEGHAAAGPGRRPDSPLARVARRHKARWNEARRRWTFPIKDGGTATLTFGYLARPDDKFRYLSSEFQYIAFDELTELTSEDYTYLFSRLRKPKTLHVPLRIRSASNPGGSGHLWVKERFVDGEEGREDRVFLPSLIADNEYLDADEYRQSLMHLLPVTRERLLNGDWNVQEESIFRKSWFRYFLLSGEQYDLENPGNESKQILSIPQQACRVFITVDPAGTAADRENDERSGSHSFSVVQVWAQPRSPEWSRYLILRHQLRDQVEIDQVADMIVAAAKLGARANLDRTREVWGRPSSRSSKRNCPRSRSS